MWVKSYSKIYSGITKEAVWHAWQDTRNWHQWDLDIEYCKMQGPFSGGTQFVIKPKGMSEVKMELVGVTYMDSFTDHHRFFGADMWGRHEMEETPDGLKLTITMKVSGWLSWLWIKLVVQKIVDTNPEQMDNLVAYVRAHIQAKDQETQV